MQKHDRNRDSRLDQKEFKEMLSALMNATGLGAQPHGMVGMGGNVAPMPGYAVQGMGGNMAYGGGMQPQPGMTGGIQGMGGHMAYAGHNNPNQPPIAFRPGQQPPGGNYPAGGYGGGPMPYK